MSSSSRLEGSDQQLHKSEDATDAPSTVTLADSDLSSAFEEQTRSLTESRPKDSGSHLSLNTADLYGSSVNDSDTNSSLIETNGLDPTTAPLNPAESFGTIELVDGDRSLERTSSDGVHMNVMDTITDQQDTFIKRVESDDFASHFEEMTDDGSLLRNLAMIQDPSVMRDVSRRFAELPENLRPDALEALSQIDPKWATQMSLAVAGVPRSGAHFDPREHQHTMTPIDINYNWSGSGITGVNPTELPSIPYGVQGRLLVDKFQGRLNAARSSANQDDTTDGDSCSKSTSEPSWLEPAIDIGTQVLDETDDLGITDSSDHDKYRRHGIRFSPPPFTERRPSDQEYARTFLEQPISTINPEAYDGNIPSRADVIGAAGEMYDLDPRVVAGFILKEQWEQSQAEDATDYQGATNLIYAGDTSIGLAQINVSNATKNGGDLLSSTLDPATRRHMSHSDAARYLASDEHNIFAAAKFIRNLANSAPENLDDMPNTRRMLNGADPKEFHGDGNDWSDEHIKVLGSEYTSRPWDDCVNTWGAGMVRFTNIAKSIWSR